MKGRILCIGNRMVGSDSGGPRVFDCLQTMNRPPGLEVIEGGLAGLNLLPHLEHGGRVVFVDSVSGFAAPESIVLLDPDRIAGREDDGHYGHAAGLPYLLAVLPRVCEGIPPEEMVLVGLEGPCSDRVIDLAARVSLDIATYGLGTDRRVDGILPHS